LSEIAKIKAQVARYSCFIVSGQSFKPCLIIKQNKNGELEWSCKHDGHIPHPIFHDETR
jgi:hypothetical protein